MKYFTRGYVNGEHSDEEFDEVGARYRRRLDMITPRLPQSVKYLATEVSLHDAVIDRIFWNPSRRSLTIAFVAFRVGVPNTFDSVVIEYGGTLLGESCIETLRSVARDRHTEVLESEVDVDETDGLFTHRLLFSPRDEVSIDFETIECRVSTRDGFAVELGGSFVVVESDDED